VLILLIQEGKEDHIRRGLKKGRRRPHLRGFGGKKRGTENHYDWKKKGLRKKRAKPSGGGKVEKRSSHPPGVERGKKKIDGKKGFSL